MTHFPPISCLVYTFLHSPLSIHLRFYNYVYDLQFLLLLVSLAFYPHYYDSYPYFYVYNFCHFQFSSPAPIQVAIRPLSSCLLRSNSLVVILLLVCSLPSSVHAFLVSFLDPVPPYDPLHLQYHYYYHNYNYNY